MPAIRAAAALLILALCSPLGPLGPVSIARADGGSGAEPQSYGPPPPLPPGSLNEDADESPRRDIHMGNVDHMRLGRDEDGNTVMEIRPRPKKSDQPTQTGPIYVYPQVSVPGAAGGQSMPIPGGPGRMPQPGPAGQLPPGQPGPSGQAGQWGRQGQNVPNGQPGSLGQPGPMGQPNPLGQPGHAGQQEQGHPADRQPLDGRREAGF